jgi:hypothetical protein
VFCRPESGHTQVVIFAFLSRRFRTWLLFTLLLPVVGRVLQALGVRVSDRSPRAGKALTSVGGAVRGPRGKARRGRTAPASR